MTSFHSKGKTTNNDSLYNSSRISTSNVNSLRKLFESNFKFSNITNAFKSKSQKNTDTEKKTTVHNEADVTNWFLQDQIKNSTEYKENRRCTAHVNDSVFKFNDQRSNITSIQTSGNENFLNCKIDNCCCKTFFREYTNTPTYRYHRLPKTPLRELNIAELNSTFQSNGTSTTISSSRIQTRNQKDDNICSERECRNKVYNINYEFYKPKTQQSNESRQSTSLVTGKSFWVEADKKDDKPLFMKLDGSERNNYIVNTKNRFIANSEKKSNRKENFSFVNFTATSVNECGYVKLENEKNMTREPEKTEIKGVRNGLLRNHGINQLSNNDSKYSEVREPEVYKIGNFSFKYKRPKIRNITARQHSYPYTLRKPRLTVKSVKNRNHRNMMRRQELVDKSLSRSQTFNGYDNFAYQRSITEMHLSNRRENDTGEFTPNVTATEQNEGGLCEADSNEAQTVGKLEIPFHIENRMTGYNWPVTSFYIPKDASDETQKSRSLKTDFKYSSSCDLSNQYEMNRLLKKSNLKRHCSIGYLEDVGYGFNLPRNRRSLDNMTKVSATCGIRNIHEVNNRVAKQRKFQSLDVHAHALFAAVEHGYVEKAKTILESSDVDVNSLNSDGLSPLDVAVLSNNKLLVKLLIAYGAQEGRKFFSADDMRNHLYHLLHEAERRVQELNSSLRLNIESDQSSLSSSSSNIPSITIGDSSQNKTYSIWERRAKGLKRMLMGFEQIRPPDSPSVVTIEVTSISSIMVYFVESENKDSSITTKFRVQWSMDKDFCFLCGHYEVADMRQLRYHINNLRKGQVYFVRVASGNIKGYSAYKSSSPSSITPSTWRDVTDKDVRFSSSMKDTLEDIFSSVVLTHPYLKSNIELFGQGGELLVNQRKKKTTIKQLFTAASKFQKNLRRKIFSSNVTNQRNLKTDNNSNFDSVELLVGSCTDYNTSKGVYLSCLLYHEDKVLVTNEDFLPVIEVDENYPKKIHNDFHWFFKVAFSWNDLKWLKSDMEKSQNSSVVFRIKLLQAAVHMQTALSIQELGKLYHKLLRDIEGTIVISVINYIHSPKSVSVLNLRWLPLSKLTKRANLVNVAESNVADILMSSIPDQITYHQVSSIKLPRGLYLSYLKIRSSVDSLQVLVPSRAPNIPPHCKIRDNPHVTAEEWEWLVKKENLRESLVTATHQQRLFIEQIVVTARRLFTYMEIPDEEAANHRLYDVEVIEVSKDVSLIMIVPPAEAACSMPGQRELLLQRSDLLPLTVQVFEMVHFGTYQLDLISTYSRLSCIIEMDIDLAQHSLRKAFSALEVSTAKSKLSDLENLHTQLNTSWKKSRWLLDVISFARDRFSLSLTSMCHLLNIYPKRTVPSTESRCYLQPPDPKTTKSRGSWPGVGVIRHLGRMPNEISRSEQHLTTECIPTSQSCTKITVKEMSPTKVATDIENMSFVTQSRDNLSCSSDPAVKYNPNQLTRGSSSSSSLHSVSSDDMSSSKAVSVDKETKTGVRVSVPSSAVIQIHAAYDTGLNSPLHFKFHVSPKTTAHEIVELFVKQTNMSALLKGKDGPVYTDEEITNFCLVAVIGTRERCLRDDFKPVQLQKPWKDGRLYVRRKSNVLAAIECDSKRSSIKDNEE